MRTKVSHVILIVLAMILSVRWADQDSVVLVIAVFWFGAVIEAVAVGVGPSDICKGIVLATGKSMCGVIGFMALMLLNLAVHAWKAKTDDGYREVNQQI